MAKRVKDTQDIQFKAICEALEMLLTGTGEEADRMRRETLLTANGWQGIITVGYRQVPTGMEIVINTSCSLEVSQVILRSAQLELAKKQHGFA